MAQKELVFKLKFVDENGAIVEKTAESINDINKSITDLKNELENTELGSEQWNELAEDLGKAENALEKTTEAIQDTKDAQKSLGDQLTGAPGIVGKVSQSVKGLGKTFKALLANPVVAVLAAIVGGLTLLFKAFTSTKAGGEAFDRVMAGIGAAIDVLRDRVLKIGGAIIKFFKGDFKGAAEDVKGAFSGVGDEIAKEFNEAMRIKQELQAITDAQRELNNERSKQNTLIAQAKLVINDETKSYEERQSALEEVRQAEIALAKQEEILAQRRYDAIKAQNALSDSSKEALDEEAAAYQQLQQAQLASLQKQKELFDQQKALRDRQRAEQKAAADKRKQELQQIADLEEQLMLEGMENARERAEEELRIQEEKQIKQIRELKTSEEKREELILRVRENTLRKSAELENTYNNEVITKVSAFRERLINAQLAYDQSEIDRAETILNQKIDFINDEIDINEELTQITNDLLNGRFEMGFKAAEKEVNNRQQVLDHLKDIEEENLRRVLDTYNDYYATLAFDAKQRYLDDLTLFKQNSEAQKKEQLQSLNDLNQLRLKQLQEQKQKETEIIERAYKEGRIGEEEYQKALEDTKLHYMVKEGQQAEEHNAALQATSDFFKDYEINRTEEYLTEIKDLEYQQNQVRTDIQQRFAEIRMKITDQEYQNTLNNIALVQQAISTAGEFAKDNFEFQQAVSYAQTIVDTYLGAQKAFVSQIIPGDPTSLVRAQIAAGLAIAQGVGRAIVISQTEPPQAADGMIVGNGSGRMDNVNVRVSNGESIINARSTKMFKPLLSAINQAGGGRRFASGGITSLSTQTSPETNLLNQLTNTTNTPMKTYVVSSDVSSSVSLDRQIKSRSVL